MDLHLPLQEYGLSDKEIETYLTLLPLGTVNLQEIARRVNNPRTTVYNTLNYLASKGLVSKIVRKGVTYFTATDPQNLVDNLEQKKNLLQDIIPKLKQLQENQTQPSSVQIYEGFKGVFTILSDVFSVKQEVCYFGGYKKSLDILKHLPSQAATMRIDRGIPARIVIDPCDEPRFHDKKYQKLTQLRFLSSFEDFPAMIFIYGHNVAMFTVRGDLVGMIVQNKEFSEAMQMIFEMYWSIAKK